MTIKTLDHVSISLPAQSNVSSNVSNAISGFSNTVKLAGAGTPGDSANTPNCSNIAPGLAPDQALDQSGQGGAPFTVGANPLNMI